jgi:hypothetical protein
MIPQTIIDNAHVKLFYHPDTKIIHHQYEVTIGGDYLKEALNTGIELLKQHQATKWLSDNHLIHAHTDEETEWINTVWLPNAVNAGWKFWALVIPEGVVARMNMNEFVQAFYEMGIRVMVFTDVNQAMHWLIKDV